MPISSGSTSAPRFLVIEDDRDVSALLASHLRRLGCAVVEAASGEAGVELALDQRPDVVVVDMVLPGMDGRAVVARLRHDSRTRDCRVVVSSILDPEDCRDVACDAMLPKPFTRRDVVRVLMSLRLGGEAA